MNWVRSMKIKNIILLLAISLISACTDSPTESNNTNFAGKWKLNIWTNQVDTYITVDGNVVNFLKYPFNGTFYNNSTFKGKVNIDSSKYQLDLKLITKDSIYGVLDCNVIYEGKPYYSLDTFSGIRIK